MIFKLDHIQCGHLGCDPSERNRGANLGLYSVTFNNDCTLDHDTLTQFKLFREEAELKGFKYFLEVFDPNLPGVVPQEVLGHFINDAIARTLAGVTGAGRPQFLKIVYHGPKAMEELVRYDPSLVVGILGGSAGTTLDAFKLISEAQKYGARVALFGRKINQAENQLAFVQFLRLITDGVLSPEEAVRAYHDVLAKMNVTPHRPLEKDLELQTAVMSYGGSTTTVSVPEKAEKPKAASTTPPAADVAKPVAGESKPAPVSKTAKSVPTSKSTGPDFTKMTSAERTTYHKTRLAQMFGG